MIKRRDRGAASAHDLPIYAEVLDLLEQNRDILRALRNQADIQQPDPSELAAEAADEPDAESNPE